MIRYSELRRWFVAWLSTLLALLALAKPCVAEPFLGSRAECAAALKQDISQSVKTANQQYAFLNVVDEATFETLKRSVDVSGSYYGLISGSGNYHEFQEKRSALFQRVAYDSSTAQSEHELRITTSDAAYKAFTACMEAFSRNNYGFFAFKTAETKTAVVIEYVYHPTPGLSGPMPVTGTVVNGSVAGAARGQLFPRGTTLLPGATGTIQVLRSPQPSVNQTTCSAPVAAPEMSIGVNGPGGAPTITSVWNDQASDVMGTAKVVATRSSKVEQVLPMLSASSDWTANNHNRRCDRSPCSSDSKWQATRVELTIDAPAGTTLRNPRFTCESSADPGVCLHVDVDSLVVRQDGRQAFISLRASSRAARFTLLADPIAYKVKLEEEAQAPQSLVTCGLVTFSIPKSDDVVSAVIHADTVLSPGQDSADGRLQYVAMVPSATATYYIYRVRR
jgi:hypothetical protein